MAVLQWDPASRVYELRVASIETLDDVAALQGEAAVAVGNARITVGQSRIRVTGSADVHAEFIEHDGVLYPSDFHSLGLATAYFNFERARAYALARGMEPETLRRVPFYYHPEMYLSDSGPDGETDNAAWFPALRSFLLFPFDAFQEIPLAMNQGVIAHEYGHGIFTAEVHGGVWPPPWLAGWCPDGACTEANGVRMLDVLEEGFADAWAVGVTRDPWFTHHSISALGDGRLVAGFVPSRHCHSQARFEAAIAEAADLPPADQERYWAAKKYEVGTGVAGALYRAGCVDFAVEQGACQARDRCVEGDWDRYDRVMETLLRAYRASENSLARLAETDPDGSEFGTFAAVARSIAAAAEDDALRLALCAAFSDRLAIPAADLGAACDDWNGDHGACDATEARGSGALCVHGGGIRE